MTSLMTDAPTARADARDDADLFDTDSGFSLQPARGETMLTVASTAAAIVIVGVIAVVMGLG